MFECVVVEYTQLLKSSFWILHIIEYLVLPLQHKELYLVRIALTYILIALSEDDWYLFLFRNKQSEISYSRLNDNLQVQLNIFFKHFNK